MKLAIRKLAADQIEEVENYIEGQNTPGSGLRWTEKLKKELFHRAAAGVKHAICRSKSLSRYQLRCFTYNEKWVVAYKIKGEQFIIYRFIWGAKLV
jgi:hypothetical protein